MAQVHRRIEKLEKALGLSGRAHPFVHRIVFVEADGSVVGTLVISDDPALCRPFQQTPRVAP
jgi:hypothetical protein